MQDINDCHLHNYKFYEGIRSERRRGLTLLDYLDQSCLAYEVQLWVRARMERSETKEVPMCELLSSNSAQYWPYWIGFNTRTVSPVTLVRSDMLNESSFEEEQHDITRQWRHFTCYHCDTRRNQAQWPIIPVKTHQLQITHLKDILADWRSDRSVFVNTVTSTPSTLLPGKAKCEQNELRQAKALTLSSLMSAEHAFTGLAIHLRRSNESTSIIEMMWMSCKKLYMRVNLISNAVKQVNRGHYSECWGNEEVKAKGKKSGPVLCIGQEMRCEQRY